jgi:hypothetical protein
MQDEGEDRLRWAAKTRTTAGTSPPPPEPPYPDFGQEQWNLGFRGARITIVNLRVQNVADYGDFREATGFVDVGDDPTPDLRCVTVRTQQTHDEVVAIARRGDTVAAGTLASTTETGDSGEVYRVLEGRLGG